MNIGENNFHSWKHDEVTKEVFKAIREKIERIDEILKYPDVYSKDFIIYSAELLGRKDELTALLNLNYEDLIEGEEVDE